MQIGANCPSPDLLFVQCLYSISMVCTVGSQVNKVFKIRLCFGWNFQVFNYLKQHYFLHIHQNICRSYLIRKGQ